jgi:hypothetical protein
VIVRRALGVVKMNGRELEWVEDKYLFVDRANGGNLWYYRNQVDLPKSHRNVLQEFDSMNLFNHRL